MGPHGWGQAMVEYAFVLIFQMFLAQVACLVQANIVGKLEGTTNTAADAQANVRKNFKHCLTYAFLGVLNGMTTAYFMNRLQVSSSAPTGSSSPTPSPSSPNLNKTQQMPNRPRNPPPGPGNTQSMPPRGPGNTPGMSPPLGSPPPGTRPPNSALDKTQPAPPRLAANPPASNTAPQSRSSGPYVTDYTWLEKNPRLQDSLGSIDRFKAVDAQATSAYDSALSKGASPSDARAASEAAWWKAYRPGPAPQPSASPLATTGLASFNAAMGGKP
jgi:hypothetical protein